MKITRAYQIKTGISILIQSKRYCPIFVVLKTISIFSIINIFQINCEFMREAVKKLSSGFIKNKDEGKIKILGDVKFFDDFESKFLHNKRKIFVWLPPAYKSNPDKKYPVLYMHDGQNLVDPKTAYAGYDWRVDETATKLIKNHKVKPFIIVGINNTNDRLDEYSETEKGRNYLQFIVNELKPFVDSNFRTLTDRNNTAIMGSSMGGLISFLAVWNYSDVFSKAGCMSSSFYYHSDHVINLVKSYIGNKKDIKIYIDHGEDGLVRGQQMFCALTQKGFVIGTGVDYYYAPGAEHHEKEWAKRLERPLKFFFGNK